MMHPTFNKARLDYSPHAIRRGAHGQLFAPQLFETSHRPTSDARPSFQVIKKRSAPETYLSIEVRTASALGKCFTRMSYWILYMSMAIVAVLRLGETHSTALLIH